MLFVEGSENFRFDDESINEDAYPINPSEVNYGHTRYNYGFDYRIMPLATNLSQVGNDKDHIKKFEAQKKRFNIGQLVQGKAFKDNKEHTGRISYVTYKDDTVTPKWVWIMDDETMTKLALFPKSCKVIQMGKKVKKLTQSNLFNTNFMHLHESESTDFKFDD